MVNHFQTVIRVQLVAVGHPPIAHVAVSGEGAAADASGEVQTQAFCSKPGQIRAAQVGLHIPLYNIHKFAEIGHAAEGHDLAGHGEHHFLGGLRPLDVSQGIAGAVGVVAEAADLQGLLARQVLHPGLEVNVQVLGGVIVVHLHGNVEVHAAHGVYHLHKGVQIQGDIEVKGEAHQVRDHVPQVLDARNQAGVDLGVGGVHQGVPGDGDHSDLLVGHVIGDHHDGVSVAAGLVRHRQKEGIGLFLSLPVSVLHARDGGGAGLAAAGRRGELRLGQDELPDPVSDHHNGRQDHNHRVDAPENPVFPLQSAFLLFLSFMFQGLQPPLLWSLAVQTGDSSLRNYIIHKQDFFGKSFFPFFPFLILLSHFLHIFHLLQGHILNKVSLKGPLIFSREFSETPLPECRCRGIILPYCDVS